MSPPAQSPGGKEPPLVEIQDRGALVRLLIDRHQERLLIALGYDLQSVGLITVSVTVPVQNIPVLVTVRVDHGEQKQATGSHETP